MLMPTVRWHSEQYMRKVRSSRSMKLILLAFLGLLSFTFMPSSSRAGELISLPGVGTLDVYRPTEEISSVALLLSGRSGWGASETAITAELNGSSTLVIGIDTGALEKSYGHGSSCSFLAGSLQDMARAAEKQLALPSYIEPMLVGYAEGATYAYGAIAEAPENTFKGGVGFAFDPATVMPRPLCKGAGGLESFASGHGFAAGSARSLSAPFTVLQGMQQTPNSPSVIESFFHGIDSARVVPVAKVAGAFIDPALFKDQLTDEYWQIAGTDSEFKAASSAANSDIGDLPVTEIRDPSVQEGKTFAIFLSGDGGWAGLDNGVSTELARRGIPVVGVSSLKYFWQARTPDSVGADLTRLAAHYLVAWHKTDFILVGYSFGADVAPFAANRLDAATRNALRSVALIGASHAATFEFHVSDWLTDSGDGTPTKPEVERLSPLPITCIHGQEEDDSLCSDLRGPGVSNVQMDGGHHLGGAYALIAASIARAPEG